MSYNNAEVALKVGELRFKTFKYLSFEEVGYKRDTNGNIFNIVNDNEIFSNALSSSKVPSKLKREIIWALDALEYLNETSLKSKWRVLKASGGYDE